MSDQQTDEMWTASDFGCMECGGELGPPDDEEEGTCECTACGEPHIIDGVQWDGTQYRPMPSGDDDQAAPAVNPYAEHRADHWDFIEKHGVPVRRDPLLRLRDQWREINASHFAGTMTTPVILLTPPSSPTVYGDTASVGSFGEPLEIRLRPSLLDGTHPKVHGDPEGCYRFTADVLMHEMLHQWQSEVVHDDEDAYHGHGPVFAKKCNEIGQALGLPEVVVRNRKGSKLPRCAQWPHNVRPPGYYLGAYDPDGGTPDPGEEPAAPPQDQAMCPHCKGTGQIPAAGRAEG